MKFRKILASFWTPYFKSDVMHPDEPQLIKLNCLLSCRLCNPSIDHPGDHCSLWHPLLTQENCKGERIRFGGISL